MLSFATTHAVASCLLATDAETPTDPWGGPAVLSLIQDQPLDAGEPVLRHLSALEFPLPTVDADHGGLPAALHHLAAALIATRVGHAGPVGGHVAAIRGMLTDPLPGLRLLAWAVRYDDLLTGDGGLHPVRRIDAVDVDGRVYQLSRLRHHTLALLSVDDEPDPHDLPATQPGLTALVTAATHLATGKEAQA